MSLVSHPAECEVTLEARVRGNVILCTVLVFDSVMCVNMISVDIVFVYFTKFSNDAKMLKHGLHPINEVFRCRLNTFFNSIVLLFSRSSSRKNLQKKYIKIIRMVEKVCVMFMEILGNNYNPFTEKLDLAGL